MKRLSYFFAFSCLFLLSIILTSDVQAQCTDPATGRSIPCPATPESEPQQPAAPDIPDADGDGTPDTTDQCPNQGGPAWNGGCALPADADGDGTPDEDDQCPNQGGPDWNDGCPTDESAPTTTQNLPALPQFPIDPDARDENGVPLPCLVATRTNTPVNLREQATANSPIQSTLDPLEPESSTYRFVIIRGGLVEEWYTTSRGYAAAWVTRLSPQCEGKMTTWYFNYTDSEMSMVVEGVDLSGFNSETVAEQNSVTLICPDYNMVLTPNDALTDCSGNAVSPAPNGERFLCDDTWVEAYEDCTFSSLPAVLISESAQLLSITFAPPQTSVEAPSPDDEQITLLFGNTNAMNDLLFNSETEHPPDPGAEGIFVVLLLGNVPDINLVGFNPQPEPPAPASNFGLLLGLNIPDVDIVGFNPQPEPPAFLMDFGQFSLNPTETGYQLINAEGVGVEIGLIDPEISVENLTFLSIQDMPNMTMWSVEDEEGGSTTIMCPGSEVSFNPQPEPPALDACFSVNPVG